MDVIPQDQHHCSVRVMANVPANIQEFKEISVIGVNLITSISHIVKVVIFFFLYFPSIVRNFTTRMWLSWIGFNYTPMPKKWQMYL